MTPRENKLKAVHFEKPESIPIHFSINASCWFHYPHEDLLDLMEAHPSLFPGLDRTRYPVHPSLAPWQTAGRPYTDSWGCVWETSDNGITGAVTGHPLRSWDAFESYVPPNPDVDFGWGPVDWQNLNRSFADIIEKKQIVASAGLRHGHTFLTLLYIRGYEGLTFDMADEHPNLLRLIGMLEDFNMSIVHRYLDAGAEYMQYPEDLGMQVGPMLSPNHFRKYIKPSYRRLMAPAREKGCVIHMHSDGDIRDLVDDLIDGGVDVVNLQDLVNGIDWIKTHLTGRTCVDLDVDRQAVTRFGTPAEIDDLILKEVKELGSREGGLMMTFGLYPGTPLANVAALMDAFEKYAAHYA